MTPWVLKVDPPKFLVIRHRDYDPGFYDEFLQWVAQNHRRFVPLFRIYDLPDPIPDYPNDVLHVPWLQDPVQNWSPGTYEAACRIAEQMDAKGVPIVNRVDRLLNASKSEGSRRIARAGLRTPRTRKIESAEAFRESALEMPFPFFVREDWGHGGPMAPVESLEAARSLDLTAFKRPVAVERIEVKSADGLYRKYRYFACGDIGVSHHLVMTPNWVTHGTERVLNDDTRTEELAYIARQDPHHERFQRARLELGLDYVAFDYGYTPEGEVVVWEANPYARIRLGKSSTKFRNHAIHRTYLAMLTMYLRMGRQTVPAEFEAILRYEEPAFARCSHIA